MDSRSGGSAGVPMASLAGFVSTSVLTSSDGLFGDNVEEKRVTEAPIPRAEDAAGYKPLYEQLQERREKKDSEWKEKNNPFAPPKGLDDEEFEYINDLESKKGDAERKRRTQHEEDLAQFLVARGAPKAGSAAGMPLTALHLQKYPVKDAVKAASKKPAAVVVVRAKRKAGKEKPSKSDSKIAQSSDKPKEEPAKKKVKMEESSKSPKTKKDKPNAAALGLVAYGSDSDSDNSDGNVAS